VTRFEDTLREREVVRDGLSYSVEMAESERDAIVDALAAARNLVVTTYNSAWTDAQNDDAQRRAKNFNYALKRLNAGVSE
jgi:hypothetical protein